MLAPVPSRTRDATATRARILAAAQVAFSRSGYAVSGIREIAALAQTSSTLLIRYFGSKAGLFEAALTDAIQSDLLFAVPRDSFGTYLLEQFTRPELEIRPPAMIALAAGDSEASAIVARVIADHAITPLAGWLGGENTRERAVEIFMLATSFVLYTRQVPVIPAAAAREPVLGAWFAEAVQRIVDA